MFQICVNTVQQQIDAPVTSDISCFSCWDYPKPSLVANMKVINYHSPQSPAVLQNIGNYPGSNRVPDSGQLSPTIPSSIPSPAPGSCNSALHVCGISTFGVHIHVKHVVFVLLNLTSSHSFLQLTAQQTGFQALFGSVIFNCEYAPYFLHLFTYYWTPGFTCWQLRVMFQETRQCRDTWTICMAFISLNVYPIMGLSDHIEFILLLFEELLCILDMVHLQKYRNLHFDQ